jgi:glycosyltransferase involved in cell wall biosynthesis
MWYVHSPIREIWDLKDYVKNNLLSGWHEKIIFEAWAQFNRKLNKKYAGKVDCFVCNSKNTQERLKNFLGKDSIVINPPVDTSKFYWAEPKNYWLSVNRLYWHKRIDLQIKAFTKMPKEKLVIVGCYEKSKHFGEYANYIKKIKPKNVKILSWVSQKKLGEFYANCKGVLATAINEDFGMSAVEAMASGKPVIAAAEGGYKETIINGKTGILIDQINEEKLIEAVKKIGGNTAKFKKACFAQAQNFDTEIFIEKVTKVINENRNNSYNSQL